MKKSISVNLGGRIFQIDEDAYQRLNQYLEELRICFQSSEGQEEIMNDIEMRLADVLSASSEGALRVISLSEVEGVIREMGEPADLEMEGSPEKPSGSTRKGRGKLFRDRENRLVGGVASGIAALFGIHVWVVRVLFIALAFFYFLSPLVYFLLWVIVPEAGTRSERLQMKGEDFTLDNLLRSRDKQSPENSPGKGDRVLDNIGTAIRALVDFGLQVLHYAWEVVKRLLGLFLILMILGMKVALGFALLFRDNFNFGEFEVYSVSFREFLAWLTPGTALMYQMYIAAIAALIGLIGLMLAIGLRLLIRWPPLKWQVMGIFGLFLASGLAFGVISLFEWQDYRKERQMVYSREMLPRPKENALVIRIIDPDPEEQLIGEYPPDTARMFGVSRFVSGQADISIRPASTDSLSIVRMATATGKNEKEATAFASALQYTWQLKDSALTLDRRFRQPFSDGYHEQELDLLLNLPIGTRIFLDENSLYRINGRDFTEDDRESGWFEMTSTGLHRK